MFASAQAGIRCADSIEEGTAEIDVPVRTGVQTGEVELLRGDVGGVAVHAAAHVMALGSASEVLVSSSTRGLVDGSDLRFESKGQYELRGLSLPLEVFALVD